MSRIKLIRFHCRCLSYVGTQTNNCSRCKYSPTLQDGGSDEHRTLVTNKYEGTVGLDLLHSGTVSLPINIPNNEPKTKPVRT